MKWIIRGVGAFFVVGILAAMLLGGRETHCPPVDPSAFWVPNDRLDALGHLLAKAERLNASGQCALEGGWGNAYQRYYIAVSPTANPTQAQNLRFTRSELDQ